ncbi:LysR family transcriptional regulator [Leisingera aquimarina]|uniref:LysR family transcriptional regulator n=1 Tax=Leisingera aquimarina TaxID=476529 RepID=UPI001B7FA944|nr:LysR family transcriptional regulator [Leisingera aquimarina]
MTSIRAFALFSEHGSISGAARAMNVTQPAVTQQVRALERYLGVKLVKRHKRGVLLTDEGQVLAHYLRRGFGEIREGVRVVTASKAPNAIRITASPSFAAYWLVPRVTSFQAAHPGVSVQLDLSAEARALKDTGFDVAIRYCRDQDLPPGVSPLFEVALNVLCHKDLVPAKPWTHEKLQALPWLQELGVSDVKNWFVRHGMGTSVPDQISEMPGNLIIEAVRRGEAAAYSVCDWVSPELESGELVEIWPSREKGFYYAITDSGSPVLELFLDWLVTEAGGRCARAQTA